MTSQAVIKARKYLDSKNIAEGSHEVNEALEMVARAKDDEFIVFLQTFFQGEIHDGVYDTDISMNEITNNIIIDNILTKFKELGRGEEK